MGLSLWAHTTSIALQRKNRALLFVLAARDAPLSRDEALAFL
jgi:hypothetical protein